MYIWTESKRTPGWILYEVIYYCIPNHHYCRNCEISNWLFGIHINHQISQECTIHENGRQYHPHPHRQKWRRSQPHRHSVVDPHREQSGLHHRLPNVKQNSPKRPQDYQSCWPSPPFSGRKPAWRAVWKDFSHQGEWKLSRRRLNDGHAPPPQ